MSKPSKPSIPVISGTTVSVEPSTGAARYNLCKVIFKFVCNFVSSNGQILTTKDRKFFEVAEGGANNE